MVTTAAASNGSAQAQREASATVFSYLIDNTIIRTDNRLGQWRTTRVAPNAPKSEPVGQALDLSRDGRTLWALAASDMRLLALDPQTLRLRRSIKLRAGITPRALRLGRRSGRIYVGYNVITPNPEGAASQQAAAYLMILSPSGQRVLADVRLRGATSGSWWLWSLALDAAERTAYVTYHGSNTTGLDFVRLQGRDAHPCARSTRACWSRPHGAVVVHGDRVFTTTGGPWIAEFSADGRLRRRLDTGLGNTHLMAFSIDRGSLRIYAVSDCSTRRGVGVVDLSTGEPIPYAPRPASTACGSSIASSNGTVIVGKTAHADPAHGRRGALLLLDAATGEQLKQRPTTAEPTSVIIQQR